MIRARIPAIYDDVPTFWPLLKVCIFLCEPKELQARGKAPEKPVVEEVEETRRTARGGGRGGRGGVGCVWFRFAAESWALLAWEFGIFRA